MKKKITRWVMLLLTLGMLSSSLITLSACSNGNETSNTGENTERTITDLAGNTVVVPSADEIENVVIVAPPLVSTYASAIKETEKIVGASEVAFNDANPDILNMMISNWESINTTFLTGYASNTEELLKLDPDIILVYGEAQKEGLENVDIPVVDFFINDQNNETWSVEIDRLMREIFNQNDDDFSLQDEWDRANQKVNEMIEQESDNPNQTGLMIMSNTGDKITVRGAGTYGDDWLLRSGLTNAAGELNGENLEVTMEQIYEWDPDIIYVFRGLPAEQYLSGAIDSQDWSQVQAFKDGRIFDTPRGLMNWGAPCSDSPLMVQWLASKNFPDLLNENEYFTIVKDYYSRCYGLTITDEQVKGILNPNMKDSGAE
jgi:iron complex transport system substrate-binding protein